MHRLAGALMVALALLCSPPPSAFAPQAGAGAIRTLPVRYTAESALTVSLAVTPEPGVLAQGIADTPPAGWTPVTILNGGTWDPVGQRVTWGPFADNRGRVLTYGVTPPAGATERGVFTGVATFDGVDAPVGGQTALGPCEPHPADANRDWQVAIGELTGFAAAWRRGLAWGVPPAQIPVGQVTRAGYLWRVGESYWNDAGACPLCWAPVRGQTVGPEGGRLAFPNGVVLEVPPGAVSLPTRIDITDLACPAIDAVLSLPRYTTTAERCLGGFVGKPEGLWFHVPVKAIVPVVPLLPGEFPTEGDVNLAAQTVRLVPTDLVYRGDTGVVEVFVQHFSSIWFRGRRQPQDPSKCVDDVCREGVRLQNLCSPCSGLSNPECIAFDPVQDSCCLIPPADREACGVAGCVCCREFEAKVRSEEIEWGTGGCQVSGGLFHVNFPLCEDPARPGVPVWEEEKVSEASGCRPGLAYTLTITPTPLEMYECETVPLKATVSAASQDGKTVYRPAEAKPFWRSGSQGIADFVTGQDGVLEAKPRFSGTDATTTVFAVMSEADPVIKGEAPLTVKAYGPLRIELASRPGPVPNPLPVELGRTVQLRAEVDGLCGTGTTEPCVVAWKLSGGAYISVDATGLVTGHVLGKSAITATVTHCRTFQAQLPVEVVPREYEVHGKLGDCEWNAPFCYFNSISAPLPFKVRLTWKDDDTPITGAGVFVSVYAPRAVSPVVGDTNAEGIFEAAITGVPVTQPYVIARATGDVGGKRENIEVRAITDDICSGALTPTLNGPYGTRSNSYLDGQGTVSVVTEPCLDVGNACLTTSASVSDLCDPAGELPSGGRYALGGDWWDTALVIPKDLTMLERYQVVIDFSLENQASMTANYVLYGAGDIAVEIWPPGGAVGVEPTGCSWYKSFLHEARAYYTPAGQSWRCWVETSQFPQTDDFTIGRAVSFWGRFLRA